MPFVQRVVRPRDLSRVSLHDEAGRPTIKDYELQAVTNSTLANTLRQLASLVQIANDIFKQLEQELAQVSGRSDALVASISRVQEKVRIFDPKAVPVPEGDLTEFWALKTHFQSKSSCSSKDLFTESSRPNTVKALYDAAGAHNPLAKIRSLDRLRRDGLRSSKFFAVTPVSGQRARGKLNSSKATGSTLEIETRKPAILDDLRRWTSEEALGKLTVEPDCTLRVVPKECDLTDHTLPSPEEQQHAVAMKFPAEMVCVDVTGKSFMRMSNLRRSLMHVEYEEGSVRRRGKARRPRGKRRNTIAGTDSKELQAIVGDSSDTNLGTSTPEGVPLSSEKKSHLEHLKEWGRSRLRQITKSEPGVKLRSLSSSRRKWEREEVNPHSSSGNWSASSESGHSTTTSNIPRSSVSSGSVCHKHRRQMMVSTSSSVTSESTLTPDDCDSGSMYSCDTEGYYTSFHLDSGLKTLREEDPCAPLQSTSALSQNNDQTLTGDSEYELFGKGSTSTTASSAGTVCTTLLIPPPTVPVRESSSRTLPERRLNRSTSQDLVNRDTGSLKLNKTTDVKFLTFPNLNEKDPSSLLTKENVLKLDEIQNDPNAMITVEVHHPERETPEKCGDSPDSGHNTCSSPVDSIASPSIDYEMSECSDLEGVDRVERIRVKTTINSSRIPSMCVITPPQSDDEVSLNQFIKSVDSGEYVTISELQGATRGEQPPTLTSQASEESEYISLNQLPSKETEIKRVGARVTLDAQGKVVYSSDTLRKRKSVHTTHTFEPGPPSVPSVKDLDTRSPLFANRKLIKPSPVVKSDPGEWSKDVSERRPLSPVSTNSSIPPLRHPPASNQKQYFNKASCQAVTSTPPSKPLSPLVSPTKRFPTTTVRAPSPGRGASRVVSPIRTTSSNMMVVKAMSGPRPLSPKGGAYVKLDQGKNSVKRSDSYRLANNEATPINPNLLGRKQYGPGVVAGPSLLSAIQASQTNQERSPLRGELTWPRSTSTPTKGGFCGSPLHTTSPLPSPIKASTSNVDLYAVIHESKKKIQSLRRNEGGEVKWPKAIPAGSDPFSGVPEPMPPLKEKYNQMGVNSLPRLRVRELEESPRAFQRRPLASDRLPSAQPTSRNDFKKLLLASGQSSCPGRESAVERLKHRDGDGRRVQPLNTNVLSTTIHEDCGGEDEQPIPPPSSPLKSSTLVRVVDRRFKETPKPALETAL